MGAHATATNQWVMVSISLGVAVALAVAVTAPALFEAVSETLVVGVAAGPVAIGCLRSQKVPRRVVRLSQAQDSLVACPVLTHRFP